ncbi:MAG: six-hairpin glycosidase [Candidatus Symbiothrix sp.]|jgi:hypothetical protein|nr:six-hairpin glycosidase [Candidatus Symbiothrix sp.]
MKILTKGLIFAAFAGGMLSLHAQKVNYSLHPQTGAINSLSIEGDTRDMNWMLATDGSQYKWVNQAYGWGLGHFSIDADGTTTEYHWEIPVRVKQTDNSSLSLYEVGGIRISVTRFYKNAGLIEEYTFTNTGKKSVTLHDIAINTPFNDNYKTAAVCYESRTNAHIWEGDHAAYVNATHTSGRAPHLGLVLTEGVIKSYEIRERDIRKDYSNTRGVIQLNPEACTLKPGKSYSLAWQLFSHQGHADFFSKVLNAGSAVARSDKYVYAVGETAKIVLETRGKIDTIRVPVTQTGDNRVELPYGKGKRTHVNLLGISGEDRLIRQRVHFIIDHQQCNDPNDKRQGAYMVYDNETDAIFYNNARKTVSPADRDEGGERLGMGISLALYYQKHPEEAVKTSLLRYAAFVRTQLQDSTYTVWSDVSHKNRIRAYNYPWIADFYFQMFRVTGEKQFLLDGYGTLRALFSRFGHGFYAIDIPIKESQELLRANNLTVEADSLLADFKAAGEVYLKNGVFYPPHEVNYEQSIVAPAIMSLCQLYLVTGEQKYLDGAKVQLPLLEAFAGQQPSYHLYDIAIRHWDGYWFGKREMWGDVFPHYWSTLSAYAYDLYAQCTGDASYHERAKNIVRNNLCLFFEDGKASCAYIYPYKVNGVNAQFYDPFANDQDWAQVWYQRVN